MPNTEDTRQDPEEMNILRLVWEAIKAAVRTDYTDLAEKPTDEALDANIEIEDLRSLPYDDFEALTATLYEERGYHTKLTETGPDKGIDVIATREYETVGIQAKRYQAGNAVGAKTVRAVHGAAKQRELQRAAIVTSSTFTSGAREAAADLNIELITGRDILNELQ